MSDTTRKILCQCRDCHRVFEFSEARLVTVTGLTTRTEKKCPSCGSNFSIIDEDINSFLDSRETNPNTDARYFN